MRDFVIVCARVQANATTKRSVAPKTFFGSRVSSVSNGSKVEMSRWKGMDMDISDDQQDITRGRNMVDSKFQLWFDCILVLINQIIDSSDIYELIGC